ncbi:MAG: heavy metal transporter [Gemmatimonadetes bacterium]|nr:heavy metal transporter [Gemmatimonadota bacterium]
MTKTVHVPGISCGHCVMTIEKELGDLDGVEDVKTEHASKRVTVSWDPEVTDWTVIEDTMKEINFPPAV